MGQEQRGLVHPTAARDELDLLVEFTDGLGFLARHHAADVDVLAGVSSASAVWMLASQVSKISKEYTYFQSEQ